MKFSYLWWIWAD